MDDSEAQCPAPEWNPCPTHWGDVGAGAQALREKSLGWGLPRCPPGGDLTEEEEEEVEEVEEEVAFLPPGFAFSSGAREGPDGRRKGHHWPRDPAHSQVPSGTARRATCAHTHTKAWRVPAGPRAAPGLPAELQATAVGAGRSSGRPAFTRLRRPRPSAGGLGQRGAPSTQCPPSWGSWLCGETDERADQCARSPSTRRGAWGP